MSEPAGGVRLVRCPNCENLLQELTDYSVYQCGGCGAVLKAKDKGVDLDTLSEKSNEERVGENLSDKRTTESTDNSENDVRSNISSSSKAGRMVRHDRGEIYRTNLNNKDEKCGAEDDMIQNNRTGELHEAKIAKDLEDLRLYNEDENGLRRPGHMMNWRNQERREMDGFRRDRRMDVEGMEYVTLTYSDVMQDKSTNELHGTKISQDLEDLKMYNENENGLPRSKPMMNWRNRERSEIEGFRRAQRMNVEGVRYANPIYSGEDLPIFQSKSNYEYEDLKKKMNDTNGFVKVDFVGQGRAEIVRKLDELKDELSRSGEIVEKGKEKVPLDRKAFYQDRYVGSGNWYPDGSLGLNRASMQYPYPDKQYGRHPYLNHYSEPSTLLQRQEMESNGFYPPGYAPNHLQEFEDPLRSQMLRRRPHEPLASFQQPRSRAYYAGQYMDRDMFYMGQMESCPPNVNRHHPSCPCFQCHNKRQVPLAVPPAAFTDERLLDVPDDLMLNHHETLGSYGLRDYNFRNTNSPPVRSHISELHPRWPSDVNSEVDGFTRRRRPRVHPSGGGRHCRPIAGGAPFLKCYNCFELLLMPKKVLTKEKNQKKMICGACSTVILFAISNKKLVISIHEEAKSTSLKVDGDYDVVSRKGNSYVYGHLKQATTTFLSEDYENIGYDFQSMDNKFRSLSTGEETSSKSAEMKNFEAEEYFDHSTASRKDSKSAEVAIKGKEPPPPAGSPLQDYFEYSNKYHVANHFGDRNISVRSERDKPLPNKSTTWENSMKDSSSATEIDISSNEYANTGTSLDSGDASRESDRLRRNRAAESFFAGIIKKSFKEFNRSNQTVELEKANVTVNGHLIPDRLIKKAEKLAGPIQPGHYWYDFRAGFWGAIGGPCLGIIPPFIEEFNYPMPEECAGGKTRVFVNGRELHQKDMNLLGSRGLPTDRDKSYIIELSGRVLDEDTGEELESLGKLAPTVEKAKRGFGMRVSKAAT
ncbi:protein ENHANCED DISEASE RESISTANCE 4-like isoform X1 [Olea europaea var. sylvestris]|uniref:protein ENHANCED DISEASE RESISTANCE 4-like isoform X1 n=1 Tax=Olea europaea var. sylvestris TaxID=158386 RepID=UPI000C1D64D1|nr:protein ENHANCED DISEASE RESISTANCE 4-like isoform X1 [Olea europaea var. sylvestris]